MMRSLIYFLILTIVSYQSIAEQITVVTEGYLTSFGSDVSDGISPSFSTDLVNDIFKRSGYDYVIESNLWFISYKQSLRDANTCIYALAQTPERKNKFYWIAELSHSKSSFYSLASRHLSLNNIEDAKKYTVAVVKDDVAHQYLLSKGFSENKNLYVLENFAALLNILSIRKNSIDLVVLHKDLFQKEDKNKYKDTLNIEELALTFYLACNSKMDAAKVNKLMAVFEQEKRDGSYQKIKAKWKIIK